MTEEPSAPIDEHPRRGVSRRALIKGGVAAGVIVSTPFAPWTPALAHQRDAAGDSVPLRGGVRRPSIAARRPGGVHAQASEGEQRRFPLLEVGEFVMASLSWAGPEGDAAIRAVAADGTSTGWHVLHSGDTERPDTSPNADRHWTMPAWVDTAGAIEVAVPPEADDVLLHVVRETERRILTLARPAAGAVSWIRPRSSWTDLGPAYEPYTIADDLHLAVVHHSVTANDYGPDDVPRILRSIRAEHVNNRGWNDIAYNFAIDRFGRIWEARGGGIDKAVVGGHAFGWNTGSVGVVFLGDYRTAALDSQGRDIGALSTLLAWKFYQAHRVDPSGYTMYTPGSTRVAVSTKTVIGHRDASATICPSDTIHRQLDGVWRGLTRVEDIRGIAASPKGGYYLVGGAGGAFPSGAAPFHGSMYGAHLNAPMLSLAPTPSGDGYWMLASDGGIFSFGDARFYGSTGGMRLNKPVVGMAATRTGKGYWLVASDGGMFSFGDAQFHGSMGGTPLNQPVVGMAPTRTGNGYWLVAADGGVFAFGDAAFFGSGGSMRLTSPGVAVGPHPEGRGYWVALADGRVLAFGVDAIGDAPVDANDRVVGITVTPDGRGYWLARRSGKVHAIGTAQT